MHILGDLYMDGWVVLFCFQLCFIKAKNCEMFANCDLFQYFHNETIHIFQTLNYDVYFFEGIQKWDRKSHFIVVLEHCISFKTHLSTLFSSQWRFLDFDFCCNLHIELLNEHVFLGFFVDLYNNML